MDVVQGAIYRHFKGGIYKVLLIAYDCESKDELIKMVVYQNIYDETKIWVRKYDDFTSLVDKDKYPDVDQKYRFEMINND